MIYVGSYTPDADGHGTGISLWGTDLRPAGPTLPLSAPSYLVAHPVAPVFYTVNELDHGGVASLAVGPDGALAVTSRQPSGGGAPCHLAVTPDGGHLLCANYGTGSVAVFPLRPDGSVDARCDLVTHGGDAPHAHQVIATGDEIMAVDLGNDTIYGYRLGPAGRLTQTWSTPVGDGTGPRHLVRGPDGRWYGADELGSTVSVYEPAPAGLRLVHRCRATLGDLPADANHPSEIALSPDGRYLYVANRGADTIATFGVTGDGLRPIAETGTGGSWPRHFALTGDLMYVANQKSDQVTVLRIDPGTGVPRPTGVGIDVPSPACVLPYALPLPPSI